MFKNMSLVILFDMLLNPSCKMATSFKEILHINWRKPNLNAQQNHLALTLSL